MSRNPIRIWSEKEIHGEISKDVSIHNCIVESSIRVNCICLTVKVTSLGHAMLLSSQHACRQFAVLKPHIDQGGWHSQQSFDTTLQSPRLQVSLFLAFRLYLWFSTCPLVFPLPSTSGVDTPRPALCIKQFLSRWMLIPMARRVTWLGRNSS